MILLYAAATIAICVFQNLFLRRGHCPRCEEKVILDVKNKKCSQCHLGYVEQFVSGRNDIEKMTWDRFITMAQIIQRREEEERVRQQRELQTQIWLKNDHNWTKEGF
jgi:ABC-type lipoprotein export system ATPase subunit